MRTRAEHLEWCKQRAREYVERGQFADAVASMMSDMDKHPETKLDNPFLMMMGIQAVTSGGATDVRRFIDGFN